MSSGTPAAAPPRTTENCRYCWMCRHVCPVGHVTARETYTPHAWALTIESVRRGQLSWTPDSVAVLYACADCGLCRAHCVTDQPLPDAIASARAEVVASGEAPDVVSDLAARLQRYGNAYVPAAPKRVGTRAPVSVFVGDALPALRPGAHAAVGRLLEAAGIRDVAFVGQGRSSGLLASSLGLRPLAASLAREVVDEIEFTGAREVVVLTAADRWTFDHVYPARLGVALPPDVTVVDLPTLLARALADGRLSFRASGGGDAYAYHDPCHAPRVRHAWVADDGLTHNSEFTTHHDTVHRDPSRRLLAAIAGTSPLLELFWRGARAHPCGAIGGLEYTHPTIASALADARIGDARRAGASILVTEDPQCEAHLASRATGIQVVGLYELLAERMV